VFFFIYNKPDASLLARLAPNRSDTCHPASLCAANFIAFSLLICVFLVLLQATIKVLATAFGNSGLILRALLKRVAAFANLLFFGFHLALRLEVPDRKRLSIANYCLLPKRTVSQYCAVWL
jgi:hypothetical protein